MASLLVAVFKVVGIFHTTKRGTVATCYTLKSGVEPAPPFDIHWTDPTGADRTTECKGVEKFCAFLDRDFERGGNRGPGSVGLFVPDCEESDFEIDTIIYLSPDA